jgi:hypothetical protein
MENQYLNAEDAASVRKENPGGRASCHSREAASMTHALPLCDLRETSVDSAFCFYLPTFMANIAFEIYKQNAILQAKYFPEEIPEKLGMLRLSSSGRVHILF